MRVKDFVRFIKARERHREAKEQSRKVLRPDPIIREYRFCNVRRNDDRVTKWIHKMFFKEWGFHEHLWFALVVARLLNNEATLSVVFGDIVPFNPTRMRRTLHKRAAAGERNFNAAYIVSTNGRTMNKVDYIIDCVLVPLWERRNKIGATLGVCELLSVAHATLLAENGLGSFMAAQVLADLKYAPNGHKWRDFYTFAASGPGSRRGLNRILGRPVGAPWREDAFRAKLQELREATNKRLDMEPLTAQDIQNCLCEFDKYERARLDEGRPKQKYTALAVPWEERA